MLLRYFRKGEEGGLGILPGDQEPLDVSQNILTGVERFATHPSMKQLVDKMSAGCVMILHCICEPPPGSAGRFLLCLQ